MTPIPMRFGTDEQFTGVRDLFIRSNYNDQTVKGIAPEGKDPFAPYPDGRVPEDADSIKALEGIFLRASSISQSRLDHLIGADGIADLLALGLIVEDGENWRGTVRIRPMYGLYVLSDLWSSEPGKEHEMIDDIVFPPDISNTQNYLRYLPSDPCKRYLEGCGGSGVAALLAAKYMAGHAWTTDIAERSAEFARFSGRLNGLTNFTSLAGDCYEPVAGEQFDLIAVHPPYVPVITHSWIFHDGGDDGERITRRHVEGLPHVLAPGGRFYCRCLSSDRRGVSVEQRLRQWLGPTHEEYDVAVLELRNTDVMRLVLQSGIRGKLPLSEMEARLRRFFELGIANFVNVYIVIQRHDAPRPAFTIRRKKGEQSGPAHFGWLLDWETLKMRGGVEALLNTPLKPGPVNLHNTYGIDSGQWGLASQQMEVVEPFPITWDVDPLVAYVLPLLDGVKTGAQVYGELVQSGALGGNVSPEAFTRVIGELVTGGFVVAAGHEPPTAETDKDPEAE